MTTEEFHKARRMFIVFHDGTLMLAPPGIAESHVEWLSKSFPFTTAIEMIVAYPRGYVLDRLMVVYLGIDFKGDLEPHRDAIARAVVEMNHVMNVWKVGLGVKVGVGQPWEPVEVVSALSFIM